MKISNYIIQLKYYSILLVLSYFFIHNIILVFIGIVLALININHNIIINLVKLKKYAHILNEDTQKEENIGIYINEMELTKKDITISLVEEIEELGFIPSIKNERG